ncbi:MAG TPA: ABC transporter ATP-binding protein, partial [Mycobacterium sp.]|nr:ABC transporter ATP-binding protein [Mycobacterium sp.]
MRHDGRVPETGPETDSLAADPDLLIDFRNVSLQRDG